MGQSVFTGINCYGMDITAKGELGPGSIRRLEHAVSVYEEYDSELFVSAGQSPHHEYMKKEMAVLQADWLKSLGCKNVRIGQAAAFNTGGEMDAFTAAGYTKEVHVSDWWHIPRIRVMRAKLPCEEGTIITYEAVPFTWRNLPVGAILKEVVKYLIVRFAPTFEKKAAKIKRWVRTSW